MPSDSTWIAPLAMIASVEVIVPAGFNNPDEMHATYQKFLESFGVGVDLNKMRDPGNRSIGEAVHSFPSDFQFMTRHAYPSLALASCSVYWPLHAVSTLVQLVSGMVKKDSKKSVAELADGLAENILRSTCFLTGWVGTMWAAVLAHSRYLVAQTGNGRVERYKDTNASFALTSLHKGGIP